MLDVKTIRDILSELPDNAAVYIEADHGQRSEVAGCVYATDERFEDNRTPYYGDDIEWMEISDCDISKITAISIC